MAATITPESAHHPDRFPNLETQVGKATWPTPCTRDYKGANAEGSLIRKDGKSRLDQLPNDVVHRDTPEPSGQLNPAWVEWLMGWPIGWTSLGEITELDWRDWSVDPAEDSPPEEWRTPAASEPGITPERLEPIDGGELGGMNRHFDKKTGRMAQIGITQQVKLRKGNNTGSIPRVATGIKHRTRRLKAIGNGQVPQVAAMAREILTNDQ